MQPTSSPWCTFCIGIILCATLTHGLLTQGEKDALTGLLAAFPNLGSIPTSEITVDNGNDYGHSWTNNFDDLCLNGDGYEYYGLHCQNGHISGIVLCVHIFELPNELKDILTVKFIGLTIYHDG